MVATVESNTKQPDEATEGSPDGAPGDTTPGTAPEEGIPASNAPSDGSASATAHDDDDITTWALWIAVVAALGLLGTAMWWMPRRPDEQPPPSDSDWPRGNELI